MAASVLSRCASIPLKCRRSAISSAAFIVRSDAYPESPLILSRALLRYGAVKISALGLPPILVERLARAHGAVESLDRLREPIRVRDGVPA